ncbi:MAG: hypothetical protein IPL10_07140 [Bacteroidetes bacterium]|nr:hypothetical protein [Bacteroidota bacterium]
MTSKTITIGTVLLFIAWLLAQTFFSAPAEQNPAIGVPVARICLVLFLAGFSLIIIRQLIGFKSRQKKNSERISSLYLKTYGSQIPVDLSLCKISNLTDKIVIEYQTELNGQTKNFETSIAHNDLDKIRQKIISKKNTILYIDTKDINKYYLDTEFLE